MKKTNVIKLDQSICTADADDNAVLFVRSEAAVESDDAILEVPRTHDAIVVIGGGDIRYLKSGNYKILDSEQRRSAWKKGLTVDIVFIPKDTRVLVGWGTPNRIRYRDEASGKVITVGANGEFDVAVGNPEQFYRKVVGIKREFDVTAFSRRFGETVATEFADVFLRVVSALGLTYDKFDANKKAVATRMGEILSPMFEEQWGVSVLNFKIAEIVLDDADIEAIEDATAEELRARRLKEYLAELERLDDKQWEREKYLRQLQLRDNEAYRDVIAVIGARSTVTCVHCGGAVEADAAFCSHCGKRISTAPRVCAHCGKTNGADAAFCSSCGNKLGWNSQGGA